MNKIGNELILCSQSYDDTVDFRKFGNTIKHRCTIAMDTFNKENFTTYFYQMYLKTNETNFEIIPVKIENDENTRQKNIVKRFFLAYQYSYNQDGGYLFAKEITFEVKLQNDNPQSHSFMNIPVLKITYGHQDELGETQEFSFTSNYYMDISFIMK